MTSTEDVSGQGFHDCGAPVAGAPPRHCIDPVAHHSYMLTHVWPGSMTGAQIEDRGAQLARKFGSVGILADPRVTGGVVLYLDGEQAEVILAALENTGRVVYPREVPRA